VSIPDGGRICIVMMSAVGDTVHVLPVVTALKRHDPGVRITWVLQPLPTSLVRGHAAVDEILPFDPRRGWRAFADIAKLLRRRQFDLVIDLQVAMKAGIVTALAPAPRKLGFDRARARDLNWMFTTERIPAHPPQHVQEQYLEFLRHLGVDPEPIDWAIGPFVDERGWQREFIADVGVGYAAINIATSNPDRDWMPDRWAAVIDVLEQRYGLRAVLVGGRSARELATRDAIVASTHASPVDALGSGFRKLIAILEGSELVLALDSAPLHMAVAVGRPVVSLMANADPRRTGPFRSCHDLIVDAYHDPGEIAPVSMQRRWGRMPRITVDAVLERVERWNTHYRRRS
jgi:heptosyltransferase I